MQVQVLPPLAAHRSGKSATISALSVGPTHLHLCAFAFAFTFCGRLPAIPYKRLSFFLGGQRDNRTTGQQDNDVDSVAFAFIISGVPKVFVVLSVSSCPNLLAWPGLLFCAPARVYNFSCFTAVVRLLCPFSLVSSLLFCCCSFNI